LISSGKRPSGERARPIIASRCEAMMLASVWPLSGPFVTTLFASERSEISHASPMTLAAGSFLP
jgi:hypothetical protein